MELDLAAILTRFTAEGGPRLWAAGALYLTIFALERVPRVGTWLSRDTASPTWLLWLTAKRKKLAANVVLALAPAAVLLEAGAPLQDVLITAAVASLGASGVNAIGKVLLRGEASGA